MKISRLMGNVGALSLFVGAIFKIMHWPGANILVLAGSLLVLLYLLGSLQSTLSTAGSKHEKNYLIILTVSLLLQVVFGLFRIMHWPGSGMPFIKLLIPLNLILLAFYFMYSNSETDESKKNGSIRFFVIYFTLSAYIMLRWNSLPAHILSGFSFPDQAIISQTEKLYNYNTAMLNKLSGDSSNKEKAMQIRTMSDELSTYINSLKTDMVKASSNDANLDLSKGINIYNLDGRNNYDIPSFMMLGNDDNGNTGKGAELKTKIKAYREAMIKMFDDDAKSVISQVIGLETKDAEVEDGQTMTWEQYNFDHRPLAAAILVFDQLNSDIRVAESAALKQLMMP